MTPMHKNYSSENGANRAHYAQQIFTHYFRELFLKTGAKWETDYAMEIELAVDAIIEAAVSEMEARQEEEERHR